MKRVFALVVIVAYMAPMLALAQAVPIVTIKAPNGGQPPNATITPSSNVPAVAVSITAASTAAASVTGITVQKVGSAPDGAVVKLTVLDTQNNTLGSVTSLSANHTATIPFSLAIPAGEVRTLVVFAAVAGDLSSNHGQFFDINITAINTSAVVQGALPLFGAQLTLNSGVSKPTCQITATPTTYTVGQTVTLRWTSANANAGTITGLGSVGLSGQQGILPSGSGTYTGTFTGPSGTGTCSAPVIFNPANSGFGGTGGVDGSGSVGGAGTVGAPGGIPSAGTASPGSQTTVTPGVGTGSTGSGVGQVCTGLDCQICSFASLGQKIINFVIGLSIPLAAVMFAWAGIMYFTSAASPANIERAKAAIRVAFWGFLIAISAWLIIQTTLKFIMNPQQYQSWTTIQCTSAVRPGTTAANSTNLNQLFGSIFGANGGLNTNAPVAVGNAGAGSTVSSCSSGYRSIGNGQCYSDSTGDIVNANTTVNQNFNGGGCGGLNAAAACVATYESSCNPLIGSGVDKGSDGNSVSWGCLQINISANPVNGLNCPAAFAGGTYTASNHGTYVINQSLYSQCVNAAQNSCNQATFDYYSKNGATLTAWGTKARANCAGL